MKKTNPAKWIVAVVCGTLVTTSALAVPVVNLANYGIGYITPTIIPPSGLDSTYLQNMITTYNGGANQTISGVTYTISKGSLTPSPNLAAGPAAVLDTSVSGSPTSFSIDLGPSGAGLYLIAQWDGPNGADGVYYIGGLTGTITLQNTVDFVNDTGGAYGLSGYWVATPTTAPDGGTTVMLLGMALTGLGMLKRRFA